jgi:exodeoxyribonuclease-3
VSAALGIVGIMRVATWNVNSIRARVDRVVDWLRREDVDVLAMQEVKCRADQFPVMAFTEAGYDVEVNGFSQWNGVGFASRLPMQDVTDGFGTMPGFGTPAEDGSLPREARAMGVTVEGMRLWSLYVPNGRELGHAHYDYKLDWLAKLAGETQGWLAENPELPLALMGDWNIAPLDSDVWDIHLFQGATHVSPPERAAFAEFERLGLTDVVRERVPAGFTYWDYKQLRFPRNEGMRIDFILGSPRFAELVTGAAIHRNERKGTAPSDHVPIVVDIALPSELDEDRPMIF